MSTQFGSEHNDLIFIRCHFFKLVDVTLPLRRANILYTSICLFSPVTSHTVLSVNSAISTPSTFRTSGYELIQNTSKELQAITEMPVFSIILFITDIIYNKHRTIYMWYQSYHHMVCSVPLCISKYHTVFLSIGSFPVCGGASIGETST